MQSNMGKMSKLYQLFVSILGWYLDSVTFSTADVYTVVVMSFVCLFVCLFVSKIALEI